MSAVINVALPVFGLILAGWIGGRVGLLGRASSEALNKFVYWFSLPALLFGAMARTPIEEIVRLDFIGAFSTRHHRAGPVRAPPRFPVPGR